MSLKAVVPTLEQVPETDRSHYVERDGAFYAAVEPVEFKGRKVALEDITGLINAKQAQQDRADQAEARLKGFGDLTPEKAREAIEAAARITKAGENEAAKWKERESALATEYTTKLEADTKPLKSTIDKLTARLHRTLISDEIQKHLAKSSAVPEAWPLLQTYLETQVRVIERDGDFAAVVVDAKGNPKVSMKAGSADPMGIEELVQSARAVFPSSFLGENASGSGSSQHGSANNNGGGGVRRIPRSDQAAINAAWQDIASGKAVVV